MLIRCQKIRLGTEAMELDLHVGTNDDRRFVSDKFTEWGYKVIAVREIRVGAPNLITVSVGGRDEQGIIDRMCNEPEFDVKC
jgi:hypothetical protein